MEMLGALAWFESESKESHSKFTFYGYRCAIRSLVAFGLTDTRKLTRANVSDWIDWRKNAGTKVQTIHTQFGGILSVLSTLELAGRFPLRRLLRLRRLRRRLKKPPTPTPVFLNAEEIIRLRWAAQRVQSRLDVAVCLAIFAGLRMNELRKLRREHLYLEGSEGDVYLRVVLPTKNKKERTTPLPLGFARWLRGIPWLPKEGPIFPALNSMSADGCMSRETLKAWLREARDAAGLPHVTWFILRHCFASHLRSEGVGIDLISGYMGNTRAICERFYAALAPGGNAVVEKGFGKLWDACAPTHAA